MDGTQDIYKNKRPTIGEKFQVEGAKRWKEKGDVNGEVAYAGEVERFFNNSDAGNIQFGTLVWSQGRYIIKADDKHVYLCEDGIEGDWRAMWRHGREWRHSVEETMQVTRIRTVSPQSKKKENKSVKELLKISPFLQIGMNKDVALQLVAKGITYDDFVELTVEDIKEKLEFKGGGFLHLKKILKKIQKKEKTEESKLSYAEMRTELTAKIDTLRKENTTLRQEIDKKTSNNLAIETELESSQKENQALKKETKDLNLTLVQMETEMALKLEMLSKENDTLKKQLSEKMQSNETANAADRGDGTLVVASLESSLLHFNPNSFVKSATGALDYNLLDSKIQEIERLKHELDRTLELHEEFKSQCKRRVFYVYKSCEDH